MMKQEDLFKKLGLILNELNEQYQFLAQNPQQLNELELELFHANANFLADHVQIIKKINQTPAESLAIAPAEETVVETPIAEAVVVDNDMQEEQQIETVAFVDEVVATPVEAEIAPEQEPELETIEQEVFKLDNEPSTFEFILNDHSEHEKFDFEEKSVDEIFDRPLSEAEEQILAQKRKLREQVVEEVQEAELPEIEEETVSEEDDEIGPEPFLVHKEEVLEEKEEEFPIDAEDLDLEEAPVETTTINTTQEAIEDPAYKPTLNDILAGKSASTSVNANANAVVKDLKQAISLNDKLLYIKDLFNGYNLAYAEAIDLANKLPNFEAADSFFQKNYAAKNNWAEKQATVDKFYALLNQRFKG